MMLDGQGHYMSGFEVLMLLHAAAQLGIVSRIWDAAVLPSNTHLVTGSMTRQIAQWQLTHVSQYMREHSTL